MRVAAARLRIVKALQALGDFTDTVVVAHFDAEANLVEVHAMPRTAALERDLRIAVATSLGKGDIDLRARVALLASEKRSLTKAAKLLGWTRDKLRWYMRQHGIPETTGRKPRAK